MWWKFWSKKQTYSNDPILKTYTIWLAELRESCERHYDKPEQGREQIEIFRLEWKRSHEEGTLSKVNMKGLENRAEMLMTCNDDEWLSWLDNLEFWKPGWKFDEDETN
ncbi:MAG: hypothetical protein VW230_02325 [Candidatus Poseidoniales archaeon]